MVLKCVAIPLLGAILFPKMFCIRINELTFGLQVVASSSIVSELFRETFS